MTRKESSQADRLAIAVVGIFLAAFFGFLLWLVAKDPIARPIEALASIGGVIIQALTLMVVGPAVVPTQTRMRRLQLNIPVRHSDLVREIVNRQRSYGVCAVVLVAAIACLALASRAPLLTVLANLVWQWMMIGIALSVGRWALVRSGRLSRVFVVFFWVEISLLFVALHGLPLIGDFHFAVFVATPSVLLAAVPTWLIELTGDARLPLGIAVLSSKLLAVRCVRPSPLYLRRLSEARRNLPDRDQPILGNLNFVNPQQKDCQNEQQVEPLRRRIRREIRTPKPSEFLPASQWRRCRWFAVAAALFLTLAMTATDAMNVLANIPRPLQFANACFIVGFTSTYAMTKGVTLMNTGLVNFSALMRISLRGVADDLFLMSLIVFPSGALMIWLSKPSEDVLVAIASGIAIGVGIRFLWIPWALVRNSINQLAIAYFVFICALVPNTIIAGLIGVIAPAVGPGHGLAASFALAMVVAIVGGDRIIAAYQNRRQKNLFDAAELDASAARS